MRDVNGLPYIPATSIVGVLRHSIEATNADAKEIDRIFGFQGKDDGQGSRFICSSAHIVGKGGKVLDGLQSIDWSDPFYNLFISLPIRQHVSINEKGCNTDTGKFDEEIVYKGTRFCFEVELVATDENDANFFHEKLLPQMTSAAFRLGSGTRKGFGELAICSVKHITYDLSTELGLKGYLGKSSSLSGPFSGKMWSQAETTTPAEWESYKLTLKPKDFFMFGSGFGDKDADMTPTKENVVEYNDNNIIIKRNLILIPATSVKGAIAHRTAFYYNKLTGNFAGTNVKEGENPAVVALFGTENGQKSRGNVIFSDIYVNSYEEKVFNHVAIDRFTGGAIDGALFNDKATYQENKDDTFVLNILVDKKALQNDNIKTSFESALNDLCTGYLALGGGVNRGHGLFKGSIEPKINQ
jgi:CRISPR/Cas system CSM-associated protein Csm3 (group 7 of RAMP superfamily)